MILEYKGLEIIQSSDNRIRVYKGDNLLMQETCVKPYSLRELHDRIDAFLENKPEYAKKVEEFNRQLKIR